MSRIGKLPISFPNTVQVNLQKDTITVKGPKGELHFTFHPLIDIKIEENQILVSPKEDIKEAHALHGLTRTLINNMVQGTSNGFEKRLLIQGVGYKAQIQGKKLILNLGYSHPIEFPIENGIDIKQDEEKKNVLIVSGIDKQKVGQVAAN
ncbi:50S ribosomal protein L6, partial [Candidatus Peregrinibacteria bacterium RIFOXYC2_FULL_33_13]